MRRRRKRRRRTGGGGGHEEEEEEEEDRRRRDSGECKMVAFMVFAIASLLGSSHLVYCSSKWYVMRLLVHEERRLLKLKLHQHAAALQEAFSVSQEAEAEVGPPTNTRASH